MAIAYTEKLAEHGISPSVGTVGDSYDNALAEAVNGLYKAELIYSQPAWAGLAEVEFATMNWVHWWNTRRLHEHLGNRPPPMKSRPSTMTTTGERLLSLPSDGTKPRTGHSFASYIDRDSRKLTGWAMADHMRAELAEDALTAAWHARDSLRDAISHSDHGSVYISKACTTLHEELDVTQSTGKVGSSADNALAKSVNAALKRGLLDSAPAFDDQVRAYRAVFPWANRYYTVRRYSAIGDTAPSTYENACDAARSATLAVAA